MSSSEALRSLEDKLNISRRRHDQSLQTLKSVEGLCVPLKCSALDQIFFPSSFFLENSENALEDLRNSQSNLKLLMKDRDAFSSECADLEKRLDSALSDVQDARSKNISDAKEIET